MDFEKFINVEDKNALLIQKILEHYSNQDLKDSYKISIPLIDLLYERNHQHGLDKVFEVLLSEMDSALFIEPMKHVLVKEYDRVQNKKDDHSPYLQKLIQYLKSEKFLKDRQKSFWEREISKTEDNHWGARLKHCVDFKDLDDGVRNFAIKGVIQTVQEWIQVGVLVHPFMIQMMGKLETTSSEETFKDHFKSILSCLSPFPEDPQKITLYWKWLSYVNQSLV